MTMEGTLKRCFHGFLNLTGIPHGRLHQINRISYVQTFLPKFTGSSVHSPLLTRFLISFPFCSRWSFCHKPQLIRHLGNMGTLKCGIKLVNNPWNKGLLPNHTRALEAEHEDQGQLQARKLADTWAGPTDWSPIIIRMDKSFLPPWPPTLKHLRGDIAQGCCSQDHRCLQQHAPYRKEIHLSYRWMVFECHWHLCLVI